MLKTFLPTASMTSVYLDSGTPTGLFQTYQRGAPQMTFLIVKDGDSVWSILLGGDHRVGHFRSWKPEAGAKHWYGVALGDVEIEIDISRGKSEFEDGACPGDMTVSSDGIWLCCQGERFADRRGIQIANSISVNSEAPGHVFRCWRLGQRDESGAFIELYAHDPEAD